jgi:hypothetical protein
VQAATQSGIDLEQWLTTREDDKATLWMTEGVGIPAGKDGIGERVGISELATAGSIGTDEVRVAEATGCAGAVGLATTPQVAARKATEHGGAPRV